MSKRILSIDRRTFVSMAVTGMTASLLARPCRAAEAHRGERTQFQIACMTLPYSQFPLQRSLEGIRAAGFAYVAWGTTHMEGGVKTAVMPADAPPGRAAELARRCRDIGLEPVMMFSMVYPEHDDAVAVLTSRIRQAAAAGIEQVLTFGHHKSDNARLWIDRFRELGPIAADHGVMVVLKQHGGETGTGEACAAITREVGHEHVKVNYDAGNVLDYLNLDPIPDLAKCAADVRSFCIKDHRNWPKDQDCGPGFGEIDHYRLLDQVAFTGRVMPLCCENIFAPLLPRPADPQEIDSLARRAREYLETVIAGLQQGAR